MKALKIIGGIIGAIALAIFVFWFGWLRPAAPEDVCDNLAELTKKEMDIELPADAKKECVARFSKTPEYGLLKWASQTKCVRDAESLDEVQKCEGK